MIKLGWFPSTITSKYHKLENESIDEFMIRCLEDSYQDIKEILFEMYPIRQRHLEEAFILYEEGRYLACIPLLLIHLDGMATEKGYGLLFHGHKFDEKKHELQKFRFFEGLHKRYTESSPECAKLLSYYFPVINQNGDFEISKNTNLVESGALNRHGIMHGKLEFLDYGKKKNVLKILSMILFVSTLLIIFEE